MSAQFWMGMFIGCIVALLIILAIVHYAGNANAEKAKIVGDRNFLELKRRNDIGIRQCEALEAISGVINSGSDTPEKAEAIPDGITIMIRKGTEEHAEYLKARFPKDQIHSPCFKFRGHNWRYEYSSFDDVGEFDLLWRPAEDEQNFIQINKDYLHGIIMAATPPLQKNAIGIIREIAMKALGIEEGREA